MSDIGLFNLDPEITYYLVSKAASVSSSPKKNHHLDILLEILVWPEADFVDWVDWVQVLSS